MTIIFFIMSKFLFSMDPFLGYWELANKKVVIEIKKEKDEYVGYVKWLKDKKYPKGDKMEGKEQIDRNNPNKNLRDRKVMNLQVVGEMKLNKEKNRIEKGWVYDSWNGKYYYGSAKIVDKETILLRGSLDKFGILGYTQKIKRVNLVNKMLINKGK